MDLPAPLEPSGWAEREGQAESWGLVGGRLWARGCASARVGASAEGEEGARPGRERGGT